MTLAKATTRRSLIATLATVPAVATGAIASPLPSGSIAAAWERNRRMLKTVLANGGGTEDQWDEYFELEGRTIAGPITSRADLAAKLSAIAISFENGDLRGDRAEGPALADAIRWVQAN
jgi:hypothetical protein